MSNAYPTLHMMCGKIASGKSTLASRLARTQGTIVIAEDEWLNALFPNEMSSLSDYVRCSSSLRSIMGPHVVNLLNNGISVVLDFAANTVRQRNWMRTLIDASSASHQLHVLDVSDEVCLRRLGERNATGEHPFAVTDEQFHQFTKYFEIPGPSEGFNIMQHDN